MTIQTEVFLPPEKEGVAKAQEVAMKFFELLKQVDTSYLEQVEIVKASISWGTPWHPLRRRQEQRLTIKFQIIWKLPPSVLKTKELEVSAIWETWRTYNSDKGYEGEEIENIVIASSEASGPLLGPPRIISLPDSQAETVARTLIAASIIGFRYYQKYCLQEVITWFGRTDEDLTPMAEDFIGT